MRELLERWAKAEPDRCIKVIRLGSATLYDIGTAVLSVGDNDKHRLYLDNHPIESEQVFMDTLQGAVQNAIEARGWEWEIGHRIHDGANRYAGNIWVTFPKIKQSDFYDNPAEALLSAYLKALDGLQVKG